MYRQPAPARIMEYETNFRPYRIVRCFERSKVIQTLHKGATEREAIAWCMHPESHHETARSPKAKERTERGPWRDGYIFAWPEPDYSEVFFPQNRETFYPW